MQDVADNVEIKARVGTRRGIPKISRGQIRADTCQRDHLRAAIVEKKSRSVLVIERLLDSDRVNHAFRVPLCNFLSSGTALEMESKPADAEQRIFEAVWKQRS